MVPPERALVRSSVLVIWQGFFYVSVSDEVGITDTNPSEVKFRLRGRRPRDEPERRRIVSAGGRTAMQRPVKPYQAGSTPALRTMIGTIINTILVFVGGTIGFKLGKKIPEKIHQILIGILALIVIFLGIKMSLRTKNIFLVLFSLLLGGCLGELFGLDNRLNQGLIKLFNKSPFIEKDKNFSQALIAASLIFCGGPMTIFGSIEAGITGNNQTLIVKAILDGITAIPLAASLGVGVIFSTVVVFLLQSFLVILAGLFKHFFTSIMVTEITSVGGLLLLIIGLTMLSINKKIKPINLIPALFMVPLMVSLVNFFI